MEDCISHIMSVFETGICNQLYRNEESCMKDLLLAGAVASYVESVKWT